MAKKKILVVDDDSTIAKALSECFTRKGFDVITESKADKALSVMRVQKIDGAIIDCMIPGMNGVELAKKLREDLNFQDKIVLISGIFKDKNFAKTSIKKSAANDFLFKPLDLEKILSIFSSSSLSSSGEGRNWLKSISKGQEGIPELSEITEIKDLEVPLLFSGITTNKLNIQVDLEKAGDNYTFKFTNGDLVFCTSKNKNDFVKSEVINKGYTNIDQMNKFIDGKGDLIAELVENSMLSPHLAQDIESSSSAQLFSKLLLNSEGAVKCSFAEIDPINNTSLITIPNKYLMNFDLIKNKVDPLFLQSYSSMIHDFLIQLNDNYKNNSTLQTIPLVSNNLDVIESLKVKTSAVKLLSTKDAAQITKLIYFLQISDCINYVEPELTEAEIPKLEQRFTSMLKGIKGKLPEEVFLFLGVEDTRAIFVSTFFKSFAKLNHPDRLPQSAPVSLQKLNQQVFSIVSEAHGILVDPEKKKAYLKEQSNKKAEEMLKAESYKEKGEDLLRKSDYAAALQYFEKARDLSPESSNILYYYWCFMKVNKKLDDKKQRLEIYNELVAFSIEDKRNELYSLVLGIFYKRSKKYEESIAEFNKSLGYNENFLPARRELLSLKTKMKEAKGKAETNIFNSDLGSVMSNIFKKKAN